jgi:predicted ATPase
MLPSEATPFFGRTTELAQLAALLSHARLITVTGTAGVGKTRLALRAAAQATSRFADGVHLVELSDLRDPELLPQAIAAGLGLEAQGTRPTMAALLGYLGDRNLLLILDTCEHLIDACAAFAESLLTLTTRVTMLATSRQSFDLPGENGYPLAPLRVAGAGTPHAFGEAVDFFAARAADAIPGFAVTPDNQAEVTRLCRRLDGVPLALELAAAGLRARPLAELADDTLLADETLRAAIGRSYDLCTPAEQALWQRLTVFAGTFDSELGGAVCAGKDLPRDDILTTIVGLVDKSVLVRDEAADDEGRTRYRLLGAIREFGAEQLTGSGTQTGVQDRFIGRYLTMARYFRDHFVDDDQLERYRQLRLDHANLRAALEYTLEGDDGQWRREGAELATALYGYWIAAGLFQESRCWLDKALERFPDPVPERAMVLLTRGYLGARQGGGGGLAGRADQVRQAVADVRDGIELATGLGEQQTGARGYLYLNLALTQAGEVDEALESGIEARRQLTAIGDQIGLITLDAQLGHTYQLAGDPAKAIECYEDGLGLLGNSRERWLHGDLHIMAALAFRQQAGRDAECAAASRLALRCKHDMRDLAGIAFALEVLGWLAAAGGQHERAAWLLGGADSVWQPAASPALAASHRQAVDRATDALGAARFRALFAEGAGEPLDDLVAAALDETALDETA